MTGTLQVTSHILAVPQYMCLKFGVDFKQHKLIARGGAGSIFFGEVLDYQHLVCYDGSSVVVKSLQKNVDQLSESLRRSFYQEVSMLNLFRDQVQFAKIFGFTDVPCMMLLKYYELGSLRNYILGKSAILKYTERQTVYVLVQLSLGLSFMHQKQFVHCDVKPDNVLLERVRGMIEPRITDFGISRLVDNTAVQVNAFQVSFINGASVAYASPEVLITLKQRSYQGDIQVQKARDTYALSMVIYSCMTRRTPWRGS